MKEKVLALAKGNFIYETPELILEPDKLAFSVAAGQCETRTFTLKNNRGTKVKGFGSVEDVNIEFLPVFHDVKNELTLEVHAEELVPGEKLQGVLQLVTDCGETTLPYEITIETPKLEDEKGEIRDYFAFQQRIQENPEAGADLFFHPNFRGNFLYRDDTGNILYDHVTKKNTKLHSMEEFLVAAGKKHPVRFQVDHASGDEIFYEVEDMDIQDSVRIRLNTWGYTGIEVSATADFIQPEVHVLWTDEFVNHQDIVEFTILADKVKEGKRYGSLVLESPYERKKIRICAGLAKRAQERKIERAGKAAFLVFFKKYLAFCQGKVNREEYQEFMRKTHGVMDKIITKYPLALRGYIEVMLRNEKGIQEFLREKKTQDIPEVNSDVAKVESYILIEFIEYLYSGLEEDRKRLAKMLDGYYEYGYRSTLLFYIQSRIAGDSISSAQLLGDVRERLKQGGNSPLLYQLWIELHREDPALLTTLDSISLPAINYGLKHDLISKELTITIGFLAERMTTWNPLVLSVLEKLYVKFQIPDILRGICAMLIRNEKREEKYFPWYTLGVETHLRMTELYEYYMYTLPKEQELELPESVLSYFQFENHLNESAKAYLYAYLVKNRKKLQEYYLLYENDIVDFAVKQLAHGRMSEDSCVLYELLFREKEVSESTLAQLPRIMFSYRIQCNNPKMQGVLVVHKEMKEETYYPFQNGATIVDLLTPNYQFYFVDEKGYYYAESVDYECVKMTYLDDLAMGCYERGIDYLPLRVHLAAKAMRSAQLDDIKATLLHRLVREGVFRPYTEGKVLLRLYDYYREERENELVTDVLDLVKPEHIKRERVGEIASDCIYHEIYEKAEIMLLRYGLDGCDAPALASLIAWKMERNGEEFSPILMKWALHLYLRGYEDWCSQYYLLKYYMGATETLVALYAKCQKMPDIAIEDGCKERLLGQVLFVGAEPQRQEEVYLDYYERGNNRVLVRAYLAELAYEFLVGRITLSEELFVKIEKEAFYEKEDIMILAALRYYSELPELAKKQKEFVEINLEKFAGEGKVLGFMKRFKGKVTVPYEIENAVYVQYTSGTSQEVTLFVKSEEDKFEPKAMQKIFPGIFVFPLWLFDGEEKVCYIYEEETGERTAEMVINRGKDAITSAGFFQMVNGMIVAERQQDKQKYTRLRKQYEEIRNAADKLFTIH